MTAALLCAALLISLLTCPTGAQSCVAGEGREAPVLLEESIAPEVGKNALILHLAPDPDGTEDGRTRSIWRICTLQDLSDVTEGRALALLLRFRVADGWEIADVRQGATVEGLTLTVEKSTSEVAILLDGIPKCASLNDCDKNTPIHILEIELHLMDNNHAMGGDGCARLTPVTEESGELFLYYLDKEGKIATYPIRFTEDPDTDGSEETTDLEENTDRTPDTGAQEGTSAGTTAGKPAKDPQSPAEDGASSDESSELPEGDTPMESTNRFMGVQVSNLQGENYAVRFLFYGTGKDTPVVCMGGGGRVTVDVTRADAVEAWESGKKRVYPSDAGGYWSICTFFGIIKKSICTFKIYTSDGVIDVIFNDGKIVYSEQT